MASNMRAKILICDDDDDIRKALKVILSRAFEVAAARNGEEALRMVESENPDLILLDVMMPDMDGLEVLENIRVSHADLPVVMLTAITEISTARQALEIGAAEYITKPFEPKTIQEEVARVLATRARKRS